jgi:hypothetical protein
MEDHTRFETISVYVWKWFMKEIIEHRADCIIGRRISLLFEFYYNLVL